MNIINNIIPVSELKKKLPEIITKLKKNRDPFLINQNGKSAAFLVDVQDYQAQLKRLEILEGIIRAEKDLTEGRFKTHEEVEKLVKTLQFKEQTINEKEYL